MATGNVENWTGNIAEIGATYPFTGTETVLFIAGVVFWLWWHVAQMKRESAELEDEVRKFGDKEFMRNRLDKE